MSFAPPYLQLGDTVAIVATARKIDSAELEYALHFLTQKGFQILLAPHLFANHCQYAGTDAERAADLQWALNHPDVKAILCARGGYGTVRIIDKIDFTYFVQHPKWVCGYSDVTVLHSHIHQQFGIQTLHCTMPISMDGKEPENDETLFRSLMGEALQYTFPCSHFNRLGTATGELVGGNLSMLYSLAHSQSDIDTEGKILFIEEVDEYLYHIDRMMMQLKRAGKLQKLKGVLVGSFTKTHDNEIPFGKNVEEIILEHCNENHYPIAFNFPAGHGNHNLAIALGANYTILVENNNCELTLK